MLLSQSLCSGFTFFIHKSYYLGRLVDWLLIPNPQIILFGALSGLILDSLSTRCVIFGFCVNKYLPFRFDSWFFNPLGILFGSLSGLLLDSQSTNHTVWVA